MPSTSGCSRLPLVRSHKYSVNNSCLSWWYLYNTTMKKSFSNPSIGSVVTVTTEWSHYLRTFGPNLSRQRTYTGTVVKSASYDDPKSFRLTTGDSTYPVRVIDLSSVVDLVYSDGTKGTKVVDKKIEVSAWEVKSDSRKGGFYTVTREGNHFSCTCVGFGFRKSCRHVIKIKTEVA